MTADERHERFNVPGAEFLLDDTWEEDRFDTCVNCGEKVSPDMLLCPMCGQWLSRCSGSCPSCASPRCVGGKRRR